MAEPTLPFEAKTEAAASTSEAAIQKPPETAIEDDSDPDFDDLDDVLDQFSEAKASNQQPKSEPSIQPASLTSGPGRPAPTSQPALPPDLDLPSGPQPNESEEAFLARLTEEMSSVMNKMSADPAANAATPDDLAKMGRELEEFTQKMEAEGIQPEDLLKAILGGEAGAKVGEIAHQERDRRESESKSRSKSTTTREKEKSRSPETSRIPEDDRPTSSSSSKPSTQKPKTFEDTIASTMARMSESSAAATTATTAQSEQKSEEALLADLLRSLDTGEGGDSADDGELSKMFLGMMEQLTNKEMLYEPMKELSTKFPKWLTANKPSAKNKKISQDDFERFTRQEVIVQDIVRKFEEKGYSDQDAKCREFIWEKMQEMQGEGAPPEELIANPFPGMGGMGGLGGLGGLLGGGGNGEGAPWEEGCPTQ